MSEEMKETNHFTIESKPVSVRAECPYCEYENNQDIGDFVWEDLWYGTEVMECEECHKEFVLNGADYD